MNGSQPHGGAVSRTPTSIQGHSPATLRKCGAIRPPITWAPRKQNSNSGHRMVSSSSSCRAMSSAASGTQGSVCRSQISTVTLHPGVVRAISGDDTVDFVLGPGLVSAPGVEVAQASRHSFEHAEVVAFGRPPESGYLLLRSEAGRRSRVPRSRTARYGSAAWLPPLVGRCSVGPCLYRGPSRADSPANPAVLLMIRSN